VWIQGLEHFSVTEKYPVTCGMQCAFTNNLTNPYSLDSGPLRLDTVRLKDSVLDDPGAPTMISGVLVTVQIIVANKFSFNAPVLAMPGGKLRLLMKKSIWWNIRI